jgi:hypothetical protein
MIDLASEYREAVRLTSSTAYRSAPAEKKRDLLWEAVSRHPYVTLPPTEFSIFKTLYRLADRRRLARVFEVDDDVRPPREKPFHQRGTVARVRMEPKPAHPFTGLFATGGPGLARLSLAMDTTNYSPSAAFKVFVDGHSSENILLDQALDSQASWDFFERAPTNITLSPRFPPLSRVWWLIDRWLSAIAPPMRQYLDAVAATTVDGRPVVRPVAPYRLLFVAPPELHGDPADQADFREKVARIPSGSVLYRMYGMACEDGEKVLIWTVRTESEFVASAFGDHILALRHASPPRGG